MLKIAEGTRFEFSNNECRILGGSDLPAHCIKYSEAEEFRSQTWDFIYDLIAEHRHTLENYCGRCGTSCRRPDVIVREQEILRIQQHLGIDETTFRERHLLASPTWNAGDGVIKLEEDGSCPFLETRGEGGPDSSTCSIHEIRPQNCRDFKSDKSFCQKDVGRLIESVVMVTLDPVETKIVMNNADVATVATNPAWWERIVQSAKEAEPPDPLRLERVATTVGEIFADLIKNFHPSRIDPLYMSNFHRLKGLVEGIATLLDLNPSVSQRLEELWGSLRRLESLISGDDPYVEPEEEATDHADSDIEWALVQEQGLTMKFRSREQIVSVPLSTSEALMESARHFLQSLLTRDDETLQQWVKEEDTPCYMCGECCRFYSVEIKPSDILRLCELLEMAPATFVERYTIAPRFSWNKKNRILKKVPTPRYGKNLKTLRLLGQESDAHQCSFLERREDGFFYCSVHSHKPQVCRDYTARNTLCRTTNQIENWGRQAKSIAWVQVTANEFRVQTHSRATDNKEALSFDRRAWPEVETAFQKLGKILASQS